MVGHLLLLNNAFLMYIFLILFYSFKVHLLTVFYIFKHISNYLISIFYNEIVFKRITHKFFK